MSDLAATNCGCGDERCGCNNNCGCGNGNSLFGDNSCNCILWIICLMCLCGNNGCGNGCGCSNGNDSCWIIIVLLLLCGGCGNNGCGCGYLWEAEVISSAFSVYAVKNVCLLFCQENVSCLFSSFQYTRDRFHKMHFHL